MPKKVDHDQRRREIAGAVARIATTRGLAAATFRAVAAEAGISVSLVQHYFGTKENLIVATLDIHSEQLAAGILARLERAGPDLAPLDRIRTIASAFLPVDAESRAAMALYHVFATGALTDEALRNTRGLDRGRGLRDVLAAELAAAQAAGTLVDGVEPDVEAQAVLSLILGLSLTMLLEPTDPEVAEAVLDAHLGRLQVDRR